MLARPYARPAPTVRTLRPIPMPPDAGEGANCEFPGWVPPPPPTTLFPGADTARLNFWKNRSLCAEFENPSPPPPLPPLLPPLLPTPTPAAPDALMVAFLAIICANGDIAPPTSPPLFECRLPDDDDDAFPDACPDTRERRSPPSVSPGRNADDDSRCCCPRPSPASLMVGRLFIFILDAARRNTARSLTETAARCDPASDLARGGAFPNAPWWLFKVRFDPERAGLLLELLELLEEFVEAAVLTLPWEDLLGKSSPRRLPLPLPLLLLLSSRG
mmetsp:Transcript_4547/g.7588  ORF Transcript_4547/g.7588 Transcript_4547/m.7588 type:complete len:274 (-) Transcript_4547:803-1624(-)